jgi:hypothetical protein
VAQMVGLVNWGAFFFLFCFRRWVFSFHFIPREASSENHGDTLDRVSPGVWDTAWEGGSKVQQIHSVYTAADELTCHCAIFRSSPTAILGPRLSVFGCLWLLVRLRRPGVDKGNESVGSRCWRSRESRYSCRGMYKSGAPSCISGCW